MVVSSGNRLGRYEIIKHLAKGGMADLLLARASGIGGFERHVVIKQIRAEEAHDEGFVKMFVTEARLSAALHHQNIVQVHDIGEEHGRPYFAMEYLHGEDLRAVLIRLRDRNQQPPLQHVIAIGVGVASALHHAHEQLGSDRKPLNIVHRDISPGNILVGYDGGIKVVDFGIAKATHRAVVTQAGTLKGKVPYMAPEQCIGSNIDRRSDVFSLGIVLYELCTVRRLFKGISDYETMRAIVYGEVPRPSAERHDLPPGLEAIILKALAHAPEDRYQTADEMRVALEAFAGANSIIPSLAGLAEYMKQVFGRREEPWLVDEEKTVIVDFDADGLTRQPDIAMDEEILDADSLMEQARIRTSPAVATKLPPPTPGTARKTPVPPARDSAPVVVDPALLAAPTVTAPPLLIVESSKPELPLSNGVVDKPTDSTRDPTAIVTPLPAPHEDFDSTIGPPMNAKMRKRLIVGGAAAAVGLVVLVLVIALGGGVSAEGDESKPVIAQPPPAATPPVVPAPKPAEPSPEPKAPEPVAAPVSSDPPPEPRMTDPVPEAKAPDVPTPTAHRKPTPRPPTKPTKPVKPVPTYDPNSLFLKKK